MMPSCVSPWKLDEKEILVAMVGFAMLLD